jgi:hypothetical protein
MIMQLTDQEKLAVQRNLFPTAHAVLNEPTFPWHRVKNVVTAQEVHSSQALAIDFFGTLRNLSRPDLILTAFTSGWGLPSGKEWHVALEYKVPLTALGESKPTQVDAVIENENCLIFIECKFTEEDGGGCSQVNPLSGKSSNRGKIQCTGNYIEQVNPVNNRTSRCALTGKRIGYWDVVPEVLSVPNDVDHTPCPFARGRYQWMRNLVACRVMANASKKNGAFVLLYAAGPFSMAKKVASPDWAEFMALTEGREVPLVTVSYQGLIKTAIAAATPTDIDILIELSRWIDRKVADAKE